jgi:hypothetical protein
MADFSAADFNEDFDIGAPPMASHKITGTLHWADAPHRPHRRTP